MLRILEDILLKECLETVVSDLGFLRVRNEGRTESHLSVLVMSPGTQVLGVRKSPS